MRQQHQANTTSNPASGPGIYQNTIQFSNTSPPHNSHPQQHSQQSQCYGTVQTSAPRQIDCFTIALGKKTGTTFPITFNNNQNYNALYDTGASASLINYSAYVSLGKDLDTGYQLFIKNISGEDMGTLGQVTCTFTINSQPFTQSFIVCRHMT